MFKKLRFHVIANMLGMVNKYGALNAARRLLQGMRIPYGFTHLAHIGQVKMARLMSVGYV